MSWQIDPDTGEEYWVEDEAAIDIPEPAPIDIPERPDDELRHTESPINIKGYGKKMAVETGPGSGEYTNDYGEAVSPEYVKDIDQTIDQYGYDKIPDSKLGIPQRPSDDKLSQWEKWDKFYKQVKPQIESEATSRAEEAKSRVNNSFYGMMANSDISLMKPSQHAEISSKAAAAYNSTFQHTLDKETSLAQTAFTRELERSAAIEKQQAEYAKRREDKLSDQAVRNEARLDDRTKTYLGTLRTEQADIGKELRGVKSQLSKFGITSPDVIPPTLAKNEMIMGLVSQYQQAKDQYESIEDKIKGIILNKPSEAKELESGQNVKTKSSGYTDADVGKIIIKNGKKFIVRKR
jgi:hypothetical protein